MASLAIPMAPEGNLSRYLQDIRKFPMLQPEEELELARRWRETEDEQAAHRLVTSRSIATSPTRPVAMSPTRPIASSPTLSIASSHRRGIPPELMLKLSSGI